MTTMTDEQYLAGMGDEELAEEVGRREWGLRGADDLMDVRWHTGRLERALAEQDRRKEERDG